MRRKKRRWIRNDKQSHRRLLFESLETRKVLTGGIAGSVFNDADQDGIRDATDTGAVLIGDVGAGAIVVRSETILVDSIDPVVAAIVPQPIVPAGSTSIEFYVSFSVAVTGVDPSDFSTTDGGTTTSVVSAVSGSGRTYRVTVDLAGGDGTTALNLVDDDSITDLAGNPLAGTGTGGAADGSFVGDPYHFAPPQLSGTIWYDDDGDGLRDPGEAGVAGQIVYADLNDNGAFDDGEPSTSTLADDPGTVGVDETGDYVIDGLTPNTDYKIRTDVMTGWEQTFPRSYPQDDSSLTYLNSLSAGVTPDRSLDRVGSILVGADGNHIYTTSLNYHQLTLFERNATNGTFTKTQELRAGMANLSNMYTPTDFAITPDGRFGYLTAANNDLLFAFSRDPITGQLSYLARFENGVGEFTGLDNPAAVEVSPDGQTLYVIASNSHALTTYSIDVATGLLSPRQTFYKGVHGVTAMTSPQSLLVTPDGLQVVVSAVSDSSLTIFDVDPGTGLLSLRETIGSVVYGYHSTVSPDGRFVYLAERYSTELEVFSREAISGAWTRLPAISTGVTRLAEVAISPDGRSLYVADETSGAVKAFDRDPSTGSLTEVQTLSDVAPHDLLGGAWNVTVTPDGRHVLVGAQNDDALTTFARLTSPGMATPHAVTTTYQQTASVNFGLTIDYPKVVSLTTTETSPSNSSSIDFQLSFTEAVSGLDATDFQFAATTLTGPAVANMSGGPVDYTVTVDPGPGQGTLQLFLIDNGTIVDTTSDPLYGPGNAGTVAQSAVVDVDLLPPSVVSITPIGNPITQATTLTFSAEFSETVSGVDLTDFQPHVPTGSGIVGAAITNVELTTPGVNDRLYTVTLTYTSGEGTVGVSLIDDDSILDSVLFPLGGVGAGNGDFVSELFDVAFTGRIAGRFVEDFDLDGYADLGEPGVPGATVFVDTNENGMLDDGEPQAISVVDDPATTTIDESGNYFISGIIPGDYAIVVLPPPGWTLTNPASRAAASGDLTLVEVFKDGTNGTNYLDEAAGVTESPDSNFLYVASYNDDSVTVFARDAVSGQLTLVQQVVNGVDGVAGLLGAQSIAISEDGKHLYVASALDDALVIFERDIASGQLTYLGHLKDGLNGVDGLNEAVSIQISADGGQVYVAAITDSSLAVFTRDASTGLLSFAQKLTTNTLGAFAVELSPDQRHVYASAFNSHAITVYDRDLLTGLLALRQTIRESDAGVSGLNAASGISMSPDGKNLYVAGYASQGVAVLDRDLVTGELAFNQFIPDPFTVSNPYPISIVVSPDGHQVVVMFEVYDAIAVYDRNPSNGQLTLNETHRDGFGGIDGLNGAWDAEYSRDNRFLYVVGAYDDALVVFDRDVGPLSPSTVHASIAIGTTTLGAFTGVNDIPTIESVRYLGPRPIETTSIDVVITFSEPVIGFDINDLALGGTLSGASITNLDGGGDSYTATVAIPDDQGTLVVTLNNDGSITDGEGQPLSGSAVSLGPLDVDRKDPEVISIVPTVAGPISDYYIDFIVDFNEPVTGLVKEQFTLIGTATQAGVWSVNASSTIPGRYFVEVRFGPELTSTIGLKFNDDDTVTDDVGRVVGGVGIGNGDFSSELVQIDRDTEIYGTVWDDLDGDSLLDDGEPRIVGATVYLDLDGNGLLDSSTEPFQLTAPDDLLTGDNEAGTYGFTGLGFNATYTVRVINNDADVQQTDPAKGRLFYEEYFGANTNLGYDERIMLMSSDDRFLYVIDTDDETLSVYEISADQSEQLLVQVLRQGVDGVNGIFDPRSLALSPDENQLYTVGYDGDHVGVFSRDAATGLLTFQQVLASSVGGVAGVYEPTMVIVSPDGKYVYAGSDTIGVFARDPVTGLLTYQTIIGDRSTIAFREAEFSSDGNFLYVARNGVALNVYQIDTATGVPALIETVAWCCGIYPQQGDHSIALSNDDRFLYSVSEDLNALLVYQRDPTTGMLSEAQRVDNSDIIHGALNRPMSLELSHDGTILYVSGFYDATLALFDIDPVTGFASILEASSRYEYPYHGGGNGIVETSDGKSVFLSARSSPFINLYRHSSGLRVADTYDLRGMPGVVYSGADFGFHDLPPAVVDIAAAVRNRESLATADLVVTFSEPVTGVDTSDFVLNVLGLTGASVQSVSGMGTEYTVTVNTGTIDNGLTEAQLTLRIADDNTIIDNSGDPLGGPAAIDPLSYPSETIMVERTSPIIQSIKRLDPEKSAYTLVDYSIQFSETVVNVDASDFDILAPGLTGVTISTVSGFSVINLQVATGTGSGEIHLQLRPDHDITDIAGNPLAIDGFSTAEPSQTVYLIERGPTVSIAGVKFDDVNGNGVQDTGEPGLPGWTIFLDQNDNGLLDTGEPSQVTPADGSYAFTDLYSGSYDVAEVFQDGWQQTLPGRGGRDLLRVSEAENGGDAAQGASTPSLSGDGNLVAFLSTSTDLVTGSGGSQNIFVRNRQTGVTTLITDAFNGGPANGNSYDPVLSANGQYVVFVSAASNLIEDDTNNKEDVFLHELATGITERLSEAADGTGGNEHSNSRPDISADGRFIAFSSGASNLVANDDNNNVDVFLLDRQQGTIEIVSVSNSAFPQPGNGPSTNPSISDNGRYVAFLTNATNLGSISNTSGPQVMIRDRANKSTLYVSSPTTNGSTPGNSHSGAPAISGDGRIITYWSASSNIVTGDTVNTQDLYWYAVVGKRNYLVYDSLQDGPPASTIFPRADISDDGRFITFASTSSDLVAGDTNFRRDVFVYDLTNETMEIVSANSDGFAGDQDSNAVAISGDGTVVAFDSAATQLVPYDLNAADDVFVAELSNSFTPFRYRLTAAINQSSTNIDFGNWNSTGTIAGSLWQDTNRDGIRQANEPPIVERDVFLDVNQNGVFDSPDLLTTSDAEGRYAFTGLPAGIYESIEVLPLDWMQTSPLVGTNTPTNLGLDLNHTIDFEELTSGATIDDYESGAFVFGTDAPSSLKWSVSGSNNQTLVALDSNALVYLTRKDGESFDVDSITIGHGNNTRGFDVTLIGWRRFGDPVSQTLTTFAGGTVLPVGFEDIHSLTLQPQSGDPFFQFDDIVVRYDEWSRTDLDFGSMIQPGVIEGVLWSDANSDGIIDASEDRLANRTVFFDLNDDGFHQVDEPFTISDGLGQYSFSDLEPADYKVSARLPAGWVPTVPGGTAIVTVAPGNTTTQNFGSRPLPSSIAGVVWMDDDLDGVRDPGELGVSGVTVYLDQNDNGILDESEISTTSLTDDSGTTTIDETGQYLFDNLLPGDYIVRQIIPGGYEQTAPDVVVALNVAERTLTDFVYNGFQHHPDDDIRISADGRYLVFATGKQMVPADTNQRRDIYLVDRETQAIELISVNTAGALGNANHFEPDVSADGRFVIFRSGSTNLDPADTGGSHDLYIRDRQLGTTALLTKGTNGGPAGGHTADGLISPDGQRVSFYSLGSNLIAGDTNGLYDTFVLDRSSGEFERASVNELGGQVTDGNSWGADTSSDGRYIVFASISDQILASDTNGYLDVFWRDLVTGETRLVSTATDGTQGNFSSDKRTVSDDGRWVAFDSYASNLTNDPHAGPGESSEVYLKDMVTGITKRISLPEIPNVYTGDSRRPEMSADGRFIVFESDGYLVAGDTNQRLDIYLYDRLNDSLHLVSAGNDGFTGRGFSNNAVISADGTTIAFTTTSSNVTSGDPIAEHGIAIVEVERLISSHQVSLPADTNTVDKDFGIGITSGSISGVVFNDLDSNGTREVGEAGLSGWNVFVDENENGFFDFGEPITTTLADDPQTNAVDEAGMFAFPELPFGDYRFVILPKAGYNSTSPANVAAVLAAGTTVVNIEFAVHQDPSSINGLLWNDVDGNGTFDAGEERLVGRTVFLDENNNRILDESERFVTTSADDPSTTEFNEAGIYLFDDVIAGPHTVAQVLPLGWRQTTPGPDKFDVESVWLTGYVAGQNTGTNPYFDSASSNDGRFIAFTTTKSLLPQDTNPHNDLYVIDRDSGILELASVDSDENIANGANFNPAISDDGRFVVFRSHGSNLVSDDSNSNPDIFVRDRLNGTTTLISGVDPSLGTGSATGNSWSYNPSISGDGLFITYWSASTDLVPGDTNGVFDLFLHDVTQATTERINRSPSGQQAVGGHTHESELSKDGRFVVFWSRATNLVDNDTNGMADVFVLDRLLGTTERVSTSSTGEQSDGESFQSSISDDGRYVVFYSQASNLVSGPGNTFNQVYMKDRLTGQTTLISKTADGSAGNVGSVWPSISGDGHWIVFHSFAADLVEGDTNGSADVFVYDVRNGGLTLLSVADGGGALNGGSANGRSDWARISGDGSTVTFNSVATNLTSATPSEGGLYAIDLQNLAPEGGARSIVVTAGQPSANQDFGSQIHMDFGDAPESYGTTLANDGPRHNVDPGVRLGASVTGETNSAAANGHVDDDGVSINGSLVPGLNHTFDVNVSIAGSLAVWIDSNSDGSFDNATERSEFAIGSAGLQQISVPIPAGAVEGETYARFRFSSHAASVVNPTGPAVDGEVEDYLVRIASAPRVEQILVNGGDAQRSSVDQIRVVFDRVVDLATVTGDPFTLRNSGTGEILTKVMNIDHTSGRTIVDIMFDPADLSVMSNGSLVDGNYELVVHANGVSAFGVSLDGDGNGTPGGDRTFNAVDGFFRKYGDHSGNGAVDLLDFAAFRGTFGKRSGDAGYLDGFDSDGNGSIDLLDFAAFRKNFGS